MINAFIRREDGQRMFIANKNGVFYLSADLLKAQRFQDEDAARRAALLLAETHNQALNFLHMKGDK